ncbi:hypothetical protein ACWGIV_07335 [Streptomyces sp. NPDC054844]
MPIADRALAAQHLPGAATSRAVVTSLSWSLGHVGPLTRTVEDAALALNVLAGCDPRPRLAGHPAVDHW